MDHLIPNPPPLRKRLHVYACHILPLYTSFFQVALAPGEKKIWGPPRAVT